MRAISSVNLLRNEIGIGQAKALASMLKEHPTLKSLCGNKGDETELDMSGKEMDAGDAIMLVAEIVDNGALTKLDMSDNAIIGITKNAKTAGKAFAQMIAANATLKEMNLSKNAPYGDSDGAAFAQELAVGISDNGALSVLNLAENGLGRGASTWAYSSNPEHVGEFWNLNEGKYYKSLPPGEGVGPAGLVAIASAISNSRAMTSLNLSSNDIGVWGNMDGIKAIASAIKVLAVILVPF
jgi:hypothetical protein